MSTRTTRRDRRNTEHGHEWVNTEWDHLTKLALDRRWDAVIDGRVDRMLPLPPRLTMEAMKKRFERGLA